MRMLIEPVRERAAGGDQVRDAAARLFEPATLSTGDGTRHQVVGDGEADHSVLRARRMAARRGQSQVRTEHLPFILATDRGSSARRVLNDLNIDAARIKKELSEWIPAAPRPRRRLGKGHTGRTCSFCGRTDPGRDMVAGPGVWICGECVQLSADILRTRPTGAHTG